MLFPSHFIDQLRQTIRPSQVIGRRVRLQLKGREHIGLCPFHHEKSPSFTVSDEKGFYHCFGCQAHGDVIKFIMETEHLSYPEAIRSLAFEAGMELPKVEENIRQQEEQRHSLQEVMAKAAEWFQEQLQQPSNRSVLDYIKRRQITPETQHLFALGYAPDTRHGLHHYLKNEGIAEELMLEAGLVIRNEKGEYYDRFRGRLIFPITDLQRKVIAFGGRIMQDAEGIAKYLNSPETPIFKKGEVLYAAALARKLAYDSNQVIVTEGYMDVIALHQAGFAQAVAPLGTAITEHHLRQLWQWVDEPILCLDGDSAGQRAMARVAELCLPLLKPGKSLRFAVLPKGLDPDDLIKNQGTQAMRDILDRAGALSEILWNIESSRLPLATPEQRAALEKRLLSEVVGQIADTTVQSHYRQYFQERLWKLRRPGSSGVSLRKGQEAPKAGRITNIHTGMSREESSPIALAEAMLIAVLLHYPHLLQQAEIEEKFYHLECFSPVARTLHGLLLALKDSGTPLDFSNFSLYLKKQGEEAALTALDAIIGAFVVNILKYKEDAEAQKLLWHYAESLYNLSVAQEEYQQLLRRKQGFAEESLQVFMNEIHKLQQDVKLFQGQLEGNMEFL